MRLIIVLALMWIGQLGSAQSNRYGLHLQGKSSYLASVVVFQNSFGYRELDYGYTSGYKVGGLIGYELNNQSVVEGGLTFLYGGQDYRDMFGGVNNFKSIRYSYIYLPISFKLYLEHVNNWDAKKGTALWFIKAGFQPGLMLNAKTTWEIDGQQVSLLDFANQFDDNPHEEILNQMGNPLHDIDLFSRLDIMFIGELGFHFFLQEDLSLLISLEGGLGLTDLNAKPWRLTSPKGEYDVSRTGFFGINLGVDYSF